MLNCPSFERGAVFAKFDTLIVKGMAILAMVFHHTYPNNCWALPDFAGSVDWVSIMAASGKVCVALLTLLSGYGLTRGYEKLSICGFGAGVKFSLGRYVNLCSIYIAACLTVFVSRTVVKFMSSGSFPWDEGWALLRQLVLECLCLGQILHSPTITGDWFVGAIVVLYFLFPLLHFAVRKFGASVLVCAYSPWVYYLVMNLSGRRPGSTDQVLFYVFPFVLGIWLARRGILDYLCGIRNCIGIVFLSCAILICAWGVRIFLRLPSDPLFALAVIGFEIFVLSRLHYAGTLLAFCGKHSANIWLIHIHVSNLLIHMMNLLPRKIAVAYPVRYAGIICVCIVASYAIENIKERTKYGVLFKNLRSKIENISQ